MEEIGKMEPKIRKETLKLKEILKFLDLTADFYYFPES